MGIKVGGVDLADAVINTEFRIAVLEQIVERLAQAAPPGAIGSSDLEQFREKALADLQKKYPESGISKTR